MQDDEHVSGIFGGRRDCDYRACAQCMNDYDCNGSRVSSTVQYSTVQYSTIGAS